MKNYLSAVFGVLLLTFLANGAHSGQAGKAAVNGRTLKLNLRYTGTGAVDEKHKIFVFVFNSTDFMEGNGQPVATRTAMSKEETLTFSELADSPLYAAVVYDPSGDYDGQSQPPSGASTAIYAKSPNVPEPIAIDPGKAAEITVSFDDTHKMR